MSKSKKEPKKKEIAPVLEPKVKRKLYAKTNSNAGARSKFDEVNEEIIKRTKEGLSKKDRIAGLIHDTTYQEWTNAGEKDLRNGIESQFSIFSFKLRMAEKDYRQSLIDCIKSHAPNDWKAAHWLLERSDPETYKLRDKMDVKQEIEVSQKAILEIPDNGRRIPKVSNDHELS